MEITLYSVEVQVTAWFTTCVVADSQEHAEQQARARVQQLEAESIVIDAQAYPMEHCEACGTEHFGPRCMRRAGDILRPMLEEVLA
jgi:hypothetical protein